MPARCRAIATAAGGDLHAGEPPAEASRVQLAEQRAVAASDSSTLAGLRPARRQSSTHVVGLPDRAERAPARVERRIGVGLRVGRLVEAGELPTLVCGGVCRESSTAGIIVGVVGAMTAKLTASLREAPATVPALAAVALFVVWASRPGGLPGHALGARAALVVLALLALAVATVRRARGGRSGAGAGRARLPGRLHGVQLPVDPLGRRCPETPGKAPTARCSTCSSSRCSPAGPSAGRPRRCCSSVWTLALIALAAVRGRCTSTPPRRAPAGAAPRRAPDLPERLPERERGAVADGVLAGAAARAQRSPAVGAARRCSPAAPCCWRRSPCSARAAARSTRRP